MMMAMAAHAIARSKQARRAQTAYDLLMPYRGRVVVNDGAITFGGVVDHYLGLLAAALGQTDRARAHLDDAIAAYGRLGAALFLARANEERDQLAGASPTAPTPTRRARFVLTRGEWECGYEGATFHVRHMVGLQHLARLIAADGDEFHVLQLAGADNLTGGDQSPVELLDARAKASYRQRIADLREDIDEADANNDYERTERLRAELDAIVEHLRGAVGLDGKSRTTLTDAERARVAVRKAITAALDRLAEHDTAFAQHLRIHTHTGLYCRYEPDPLHPLEWDTARRTS